MQGQAIRVCSDARERVVLDVLVNDEHAALFYRVEDSHVHAPSRSQRNSHSFFYVVVFKLIFGSSMPLLTAP
jgi:hypothetical protein